jgi:hypothetical protein
VARRFVLSARIAEPDDQLHVIESKFLNEKPAAS